MTHIGTHTDLPGIVGVVVAGGKAARMNNLDKPLLPLADKPLIKHVVDLAQPQVDTLVISVNRNLKTYSSFDLPLVTDLAVDCDGPLLGICSAMQWFQDRNWQARYLACFPADVPSFPGDLVSRMHALLQRPGREAHGNTVAWCQTGDQAQPLFSLWPCSILATLREAVEKGIHGPRLFFRDHPNTILKLPEPSLPQFFNINTPQQLAAAEQWFNHQNQAN